MNERRVSVGKIDRRNLVVINNSTPVQDEISFASHFTARPLSRSPSFLSPSLRSARRSKGNLIFSRKGFPAAPENRAEKSLLLPGTPPKYLIPFSANWTVLLRDAYFRWRFYYVYWERSAFSRRLGDAEGRKKKREKIKADEEEGKGGGSRAARPCRVQGSPLGAAGIRF